MNRRFVFILAIALILCIGCVFMTGCDETEKDGNNAVVVIPEDENKPSVDTKPVAKNFVITVNNGNTTQDFTYSEGASVTVVAEDNGKVFVEWRYQGEKVTEEREYTFIAGKDVTLTAIYADKFIFTLDAGNGEVSARTVNVLYGYDYVLPIPTQKHFIFLGWYYGGKAYTGDDGKSLSAYNEETNKILVAKYKEKPLYLITVTDGEGDNFSTVGTMYHEDEEITITAKIVTDRACSGWYDAENNRITETGTYTFTVKEDRTFTAKYYEAFTLRVSNGTGGGKYASNTVVRIHLSGSPIGKQFSYWQDNEGTNISNEPDFDYTVIGSNSLSVVFTDIMYELKYTVDGVLHKKYDLKYNDPVPLEATPIKEHFIFSSWTGYVAKMPAKNLTITGIFTKEKFTVTVRNGNGGGVYEWDSLVSVSANIPTGKQFLRWKDYDNGDEISTNNPYSFNITEDVNLEAEFEDVTYKLIYNVVISGKDLNNLPSYENSLVKKSVGGVYATFNLLYGQNCIILDNLVCEHYTVFSGWDYVPSTMPANNLIINGYFSLEKLTVTVNNGSILGTTATSTQFDYDSEITLSAIIPDGYEFVEWYRGKGTVVSTHDPYIFNIRENNVVYTARTQLTKYYVNYYTKIFENDSDKDAFTPENKGNFTLTHTSDSLYYGNTIPAVASPIKEHYWFGGWSEIPLTMPAESIDIYGYFHIDMHNIAIGNNANTDLPSGYITAVNGQNLDEPVTSGSYAYGSILTLTSEIPVGQSFVKWTKQGSQVALENSSAVYTYSVSENVNIVAHFEYVNYKLTYNLDGQLYVEQYYNFDTVIDLPTQPTKAHYHFSGWTLTDGQSIPTKMPAEDITFVGNLIIDVHTISVTNGRIIAVNGVNLVTAITEGSYAYGTKLTLIANVLTGKWFKKWLDSSYPYNIINVPSEDISLSQFEYTLNSNESVIAYYEPSRHTVFVNSYGLIDLATDENIEDSVTVDYNTEVTVKTIGARPGERYLKILQDGTERVAAPTSSYTFNITEDTVFTVEYEYITYTVTYHLNGATYNNTIYGEVENHIYTDEITMRGVPDAIEHYHFGGWEISGYETYPAMITHIVNNIHVFGTYYIDTHTVSVVGGKIISAAGTALTEPAASQIFDYGTEDIVISPDVPIGKYFTQWQISGVEVSTDSNYTIESVTGDKTYTAVFDYIDYYASFYVKGATYGDDYVLFTTQTYHYQQELFLPTKPTATDYGFIGWYTGSQIEQSATPTIMPLNDISIYGHFEYIYIFTQLSQDGNEYSVSKNINVSRNDFPSSVTLPTTVPGIEGSTVTQIGDLSGISTTEIIVGNNITAIEQNALNSLSLTNLSLPFVGRTIDAIGENGRLTYVIGSSYVKNVTITNDTTIPDYAFYQLAADSISLPNDIVSIGAYAFSRCENIVLLEIPYTVTTIGNFAFSECSKVETINYNAENLTDLMNTNCVFAQLSANVTVNIGAGVTRIPNNLFAPTEDNNMVSGGIIVNFVDTTVLTEIGDNAFYNVKLTSISIPDSVTTIGQSAFEGTLLTQIDVKQQYTSIGAQAFANIVTAQTINYNARLSGLNIESLIFKNTTGVINIGANTNIIAQYLFYDAAVTALNTADTDVYTMIESYAFGNCAELTTVSLPSTVTSFGARAFENTIMLSEFNVNSVLDDFTSVDMPFLNAGTNSGFAVAFDCNRIPAYMFYSDNLVCKLTSVNGNEHVVEIGQYAFGNCTYLTSVSGISAVNKIEQYAFINCSSLSEILISILTTVIGGYAFDDCGALTIYCQAGAKLPLWDDNWNPDSLPVMYTYQAIEDSGFAYVTANGFAYIVDYRGVGGAVTVPTTFTHESVDYTVVDIAAVFRDNTMVTSVVLPMQITEIHEYTFYGCTSLITVTGGAVTDIGNHAFYNCSSLASFDTTLTETIGNYAFWGCSVLESTTINSMEFAALTTLEEYAFYGCAGLEDIDLSDSEITVIAENTFANCTSLISVSLPQSLKSISDNAFEGCTSMNSFIVDINNTHYSAVDGVLFDKSVEALIQYPVASIATSYVIPATVKYIFENAFYAASNLTALTIPESILIFGTACFAECTNLVTINYNATNAALYNDSDNLIFKNAGTTGSGITINIGVTVSAIPSRLFYNSGASVVSVVFTPVSTVETIGSYSFAGMALTTLEIPASVTTIGEKAFYDCAFVTQINYNATAIADVADTADILGGLGANIGDANYVAVNVASNVTRIPDYLFNNVSKVNSITFDTTTVLLSIGKKAFYGTSITAISLPDCVMQIFDYAFYNLAFTDLTLPTSLIYVGEHAFYGMAEIATLLLPISLVEIADYAFAGFSSLTEITLPASLTELGGYAFSGCSELLTVNYNATAISVADYGFAGIGNTEDTNYITVNIGSNVQIVPSGIFRGVTDLKTLVFTGNTVCSEIGSYAFNGCTSLDTITDLPVSIVTIGEGAFTDTAIADMNLSSVNSIGNDAFADCSNLTSIVFGNLTTIGNSAFKNCVLLETDIPSTVTTLGESSFENCEAITVISIPNGVTILPMSVFKDCLGITTVNNMHTSILEIRKNAFSGCSALTAILIPENVTVIGDGAYDGCVSVATLDYKATSLIPNGGYTTSIANTTFRGVGSGTTGTDIVVGANVTSLSDYLFYSNDSLLKIKSLSFALAEGVSALKNIGAFAFYGASEITVLDIPEGVEKVQENAFAYCTAVTTITLPSTLNRVDGAVFEHDKLVTTLNFNCQNLDNSNAGISAFYKLGQDGLGVTMNVGKNVEIIPPSVFYIDANNLESSMKLVSIIFAEDSICNTIGEKAFANQVSLATISGIPATLTTIKKEAFLGCAALSINNIMDNATEIGENAFKGSGITKIVLNEGLEELGNGAFSNCSSVTDVIVNSINMNSLSVNFNLYNSIFESIGGNDGFNLVIGENVPYIPDYFMHNFEVINYAQEKVTLLNWTVKINSLQKIGLSEANALDIPVGDFAFAGASGLDSIKLGSLNYIAELTEEYISVPQILIGRCAFFGCPDLASVTLNNVKFVYLDNNDNNIENEYAFAYSGLTNLTIGSEANIGKIAAYTFTHSGLTTINYQILQEPLIGTLGDYAFAFTEITEFRLGNNWQIIGRSAFEGCTALTKFYMSTTINSIGERAFYGCTSLDTIVVAPSNGTGTTNDTLTVGSGNGQTIEYIFANAFYGVKWNVIIIPYCQVNIDENAFTGIDGTVTDNRLIEE